MNLRGIVEAEFAPPGTGASNAAIRRLGWAVSALVVVFIGGFLWWASIAALDEVTRGDGRVIPSQRVQVVQNLEGGIVSEILVREGQIVARDAVLVRIANTAAEADLQGNRAQAFALQAAIARLEAEITGAAAPSFSDELLRAAPEIAESERRLMRTRAEQLDAQLAVIRDQVDQRRNEIAELEGRIAALERSRGLAQSELAIVEPLVARGSAARLELVRIQQRISDLQGQLTAAELAVPRSRSALAEARKRLEERGATFRSDANADLNQKRAQLAGVTEKLLADRDRVTRTEVRSPVRGTVKELKITTVGGVIRPGQDIVDVVPLEDSLLVEAQIRPADIAFVRPGQPAVIKITAYDFAIYGGLKAELEQISADTIQDERGERWFRVRLRTAKAHLGPDDSPLPIIPGMTAGVEILTGRKTVLDYLLKPILKARDRALRER
ncbi:MAG: HlyD family type I secretion periplasmic adaptor subunit [Alphaproteobacteria bacterium]|nr:HlyD family type I secretion periplasmic adaptor subunit [Alphaproteobacteria bacterium]